jgi:hypothetical protein
MIPARPRGPAILAVAPDTQVTHPPLRPVLDPEPSAAFCSLVRPVRVRYRRFLWF